MVKPKCLPFALLLVLWSGCFGMVASLEASPRLITTRDQSSPPLLGGDGDSAAPVITPDARYILFGSSANNLLAQLGTNGMAWGLPAPLNVFLHDRLSNTTELVSVNWEGSGPGNGGSTPFMISADGRYALFESTASNLVLKGNNKSGNVYLRDMVAGKTVLVSVNTNGANGNGASRSAAVTPDGRYVAFVSDASDLVPNDTNNIPDVFVRDVLSGVTTLATPGAATIGSISESPSITPDGRLVAFYSTASNLVPGPATNYSEIYVHDSLQNTTICVSCGALSAFLPAPFGLKLRSFSQAMSSDGQFIAYEVVPTWPGGNFPGMSPKVFRYNLQTGILDLVSTNGFAPFQNYESAHTLDMTPDGRFIAFIANSTATTKEGDAIYVWDAQTGVSTLASGDLDGQVPTNSICMWPALDPSGRFVTFLSTGANLVTNALQGEFHVYLRDLVAGSTILLDVDSNGVGSGVSPGTVPQLSADGGTVVFDCPDGSLFPNDRNHALDIVARDVAGGNTELISAAGDPSRSLSANGHSSLASSALSAHGRYIAFISGADDLVPNDTNGCTDVFVRDLAFGTNILVSGGTNGVAADALSTEACMDGSGRYVAFTSTADNLVSNDTNQTFDVFIRDLVLGTTILGSVSSNGVSSGNGPSGSPLLSRNGRVLLFQSSATDLAPGTVKYHGPNLFLRDLGSGATYALSSNSVSCSAMTPDGRFVALTWANPGTAPQLGLWDSQAGTFVYTNAIPGVFQLAISPDGRMIVYATNSELEVLDWALNTNWTISPFVRGSHPGLKFSSDGGLMAFSAPSGATLNAIRNVFVYDFQTLSRTLISRSVSGTAADGPSDSPDITPDGRFVAYRSLASNLVPGMTNSAASILLYDRSSGLTTLVSRSQASGSSANSISIAPIFSSNGRELAFQSWASDLVPNDFNQSQDLFAVNLLYADVGLVGPSGAGHWVSWPADPGQSYRVQFKQNLGDPLWQDATGAVTNIGPTQYFHDSNSVSGQRFYRVIQF